MKKSLFFFAFFLACSTLFSQNVEHSNRIDLTNKKAVLFSVDQLKLQSFQGGVGLKEWSNNQIAYYGTINATYSYDRRDKTNEVPGSETYQEILGFAVGFVKSFSKQKKLIPFYGGQAGIEYKKNGTKTLKLERFFYSPHVNNENSQRLYRFALFANFGIEYFIKKNISLSGQYNLGGYYSFGKEKTVSSIVNVEQDISQLSLGVSSSSLNIAVYF